MSEVGKEPKPAPVGTCCAKLLPGEVPYGPREYIYNLLPQPPCQLNPQKKLPRIRRQPPPLPDVVPKVPMKTMGPPSHPHLNFPKPPNKFPFQTKHWRTPFIEKKCMQEKVALATRAFEKLKAEHPTGRIKDACCAGTKPPVPTTQGLGDEYDANGIPARCLKTKQDINRTNWIERNAIRAITSKPGYRAEHPEHRVQVYTRHGDKMYLDNKKTHSGLEKLFVYKPAYGKVPKYIKIRAKAIKETRELYSHYLNEKSLQGTDYLLTEEERKDLLFGLKAAWDRYNASYLRLSSSSTTLKSKAYKVYLEKQLDCLEKDIQLVQSHPYIFVEADKEPGVGSRTTREMHA
ncbi:unnamed protein product [Schistocephalus solidus]|uniref:Enkurin n=1 Tax=Schistocephalus solidus TaxID=70667 RepID=A0A0X3P3U5_SCHSO|nr:unnamed protein product [Schistocephalus solidus]